MRIGTKSLLFGAHQFILHPILVAMSWWKLYGAPFDPRLWVAFVVHDWGYWGRGDVDGIEGETHIWLGGLIMGIFGGTWMQWTRCHSRFYCRHEGLNPSSLCAADKIASCWLPAWLYLMMTRATGELDEYMGREKHHQDLGTRFTRGDRNQERMWFYAYSRRMERYVDERTGLFWHVNPKHDRKRR